uniref:Uncharacterized protein n=1 Tax=Timema cristinae TaxID=61476 RepID=A0A7R9CRE5_TIMCR|nr:unnamed protein product [Timema cristinae]
MDSCFPPFAALSLRDNSNRKSGAGRNGSRPISAQVPPGGSEVPTEKIGKIEILQDLELFYIRQIAHNLKNMFNLHYAPTPLGVREQKRLNTAGLKAQWRPRLSTQDGLTRNNPLTSSLATRGPQVFGVDTVREQVVDKYSSSMVSLVLSVSSHLTALKSYQTKLYPYAAPHDLQKHVFIAAVTSDSRNLGIYLNVDCQKSSCELSVSTKEAMGLLYQGLIGGVACGAIQLEVSLRKLDPF